MGSSKIKHYISELPCINLNIFDSLWNEIIIVDYETLECLYLNNAVLTNTGYKSAELVGKSISVITPDFNINKIRELIKPLLNHEKINLIHRATRQRKDGTKYKTKCKLQLLKLCGKNVIVAINQDLTELNRALETEKNYFNIVDKSWNEVYIFDKDTGQMLYANKTAIDNSGYTLEELNSFTCYKLLAEYSQLSIDKIKKGLINKEQEQYIIETKLKRKDGTSYFVELCIRQEYYKDKKTFIVIARNLENRKELEEKLKSANFLLQKTIQERNEELNKLGNAYWEQNSLLSCILDSISDIVFVKDKNNNYIECNQASCDFLNLDRDQIIGKSAIELLGEKSGTEVFVSDKEVFNTGKTTTIEIWILKNDGTRILLETIKSPLHDNKGNIIGLIGVSRNITERKLLTEELLAANKQLERFNLVMLHREERVLELKLEVNELLKRLGENPRYKTAGANYDE